MQIVSRLLLIAIVAVSLSTNAIADASIGAVSELSGKSEIIRKDTSITTAAKLPIEQLDKIQTGNGRVQITFVDDSTVKVTEHSKLIIDDFVYSGKPNTSKMALKFATGTVRFTTGQKGLIDKNNIDIQTPTATIAIRGTDFTSTVDDFGKSLIILLPEEDGTVGKITVTTGAGEVTLTRAFESTMVNTFDSAPSKPAILNISLSMIDNMMIVSPPTEVKNNDEYVDRRANLLDLSELNIDYLKITDLQTNFLASSALDNNRIEKNFLEDYLREQNANLIDSLKGITLQGTRFGQDPSTQIYAYLSLNKLVISRSVDNEANIFINRDSNVDIIIDSNGISNSVKVNEGGSNIIVRQNN